MNRFILMVGLCFFIAITPALAQSNQYPDPNRQTIWNNFTDSLHTLGKTPAQAKIIRRQLHNQRKYARIQSINEARSRAWQNSQNQ